MSVTNANLSLALSVVPPFSGLNLPGWFSAGRFPVMSFNLPLLTSVLPNHAVDLPSLLPELCCDISGIIKMSSEATQSSSHIIKKGF